MPFYSRPLKTLCLFHEFGNFLLNMESLVVLSNLSAQPSTLAGINTANRVLQVPPILQLVPIIDETISKQIVHQGHPFGQKRHFGGHDMGQLVQPRFILFTPGADREAGGTVDVL